MNNEDLCKSCSNCWTDYPIVDGSIVAVSHCIHIDNVYGFKNDSEKFEELVPYPCSECPFNKYKSK